MQYTPDPQLPPDPKQQTKTERLNRLYFMDAMYQVEHDLLHGLYAVGTLPDEWNEIAYESGGRASNRVKITMRVDADVVKFFKALDGSYQEKMNRVLKSFVHARLAKMVSGPDTSDFVLRPEKVLEERARRRQWGETADFVEEKGR